MTIYDGRESFYQWDLNQKVTSDSFQVGDKIHFYSMRHATALVTQAYLLGNKVVADVPNILLQTTNPVRVYRFVGDSTSAQTVDEQTFSVKAKQQPSDYFYTETELYELRADVEQAVKNANVTVEQLQLEVDEAEQQRTLAESERRTAELTRVTNETTRTIAETNRGNAETARVGVENLRVQAESNRVTAENERATAEQARVDAEVARQTAEQERQSAETLRQTTFEQSYNNVSNALKGSVSGAVVRVDDVSPIEHSVKAKVKSKNLLDIASLVGENFVKNEDETYTLTKNGDKRFSAEIYLDEPIKVGTLVTISAEAIEGTASIIAVQFLSADRKQTYGINLSKTTLVKSAEIGIVVSKVRIYLPDAETDGNYAVFRNLQIELGDTATEYTPYIDPTTVTIKRYGADENDNPQTYVPSADGTCDIASLSPTMTLVTDTAGVTIEAEYNRDSNIVINELQLKINELETLIKSHITV